MSLDVITPKHSFVRFDGGLADMVMPVFGSVAIAFQFTISIADLIAFDDAVTIAIADSSNTIIYTHPSFVAENVCLQGKLTGIDLDNDFPITLGGGTVPTKEFLFALLQSDHDLNVTGLDFEQCCAPSDTSFDFGFQNKDHVDKHLLINFYKGVQQVTIPDNADSAFGAVPVALDDCFKYVIIHGADKVFSNTFKRVANSKFLTKVTYSSNENAYGFSFLLDDVFNQVWLPVYSKNPRYPETRKVYIKSDKSYKVQSATIEKEFECKTDRLVDEMHEKITVMLAMDNIHFKNTKIDSPVTKKSEDYAIDWVADDYIGSDSAIATFKVLQPFEGRNSNCEKRLVCPS